MNIEDLKSLMDAFDPAALLPELNSVLDVVLYAVRIATLLGPVVLLVSALLTGGYLLPVSINGFFPGHSGGHGHGHHEEAPVEKCEVSASMLIPMIILAVLLFVLGFAPALVESAAAAVAAAVL